jgi:hypothetical protein
MASQLSHPGAHRVSVERRIKPDAAAPALRKAVLGLNNVAICTIPWARIRGAGIEVEQPEAIDDPPRGDVGLRLAD